MSRGVQTGGEKVGISVSIGKETLEFIDKVAGWNNTNRSHIIMMFLSIGVGRMNKPDQKSQGELALECIRREYTQPSEYVTPVAVDPRYALLLNEIEDLIDEFRGRNAETT